VQRYSVGSCVTWLLSISAFAAAGAGQQAGQPSASSRATADTATRTSSLADAGPAVTLKDGRLSVRLRNRSLGSLIDEISTKAGVPIVISDEVGAQLVSVSFQNLPLDEGLRQILSKQDAFFFYGVDEQEPSSLKVVWVYPKGQGRGMAPVPPDKWASTKDLEAMADDKDPRARSRAIEALVERKGEAALDVVLKALQDSNDEVRAQALYGAVKAGVQLSDGVLSNLMVNDPSPDVRLLALQGLSNSPDARVAAEHAVDDPSEPVRVQAQEILTRLDEESGQSEQPNPPSGDEQPTQ
jgi:hypothetical protein